MIPLVDLDLTLRYLGPSNPLDPLPCFMFQAILISTSPKSSDAASMSYRSFFHISFRYSTQPPLFSPLAVSGSSTLRAAGSCRILKRTIMATAMAKRLEGKTIIVTGASSGIGRSTGQFDQRHNLRSYSN